MRSLFAALLCATVPVLADTSIVQPRAPTSPGILVGSDLYSVTAKPRGKVLDLTLRRVPAGDSERLTPALDRESPLVPDSPHNWDCSTRWVRSSKSDYDRVNPIVGDWRTPRRFDAVMPLPADGRARVELGLYFGYCVMRFAVVEVAGSRAVVEYASGVP